MTNKAKQAKEPTGNQLLVNISTLVDNSAIRTETIEGVEFTVLPSKTLPKDIVMNGIMYPADEVKRTIDTLNMTPVTLGHPVVNGRFADAYDMMSQAKHGLSGAFNKVTGQAQDGSWLVDKYIPTEALQNSTRGKIVANAIAKKQPIHTSTGVYLSRVPELGTNALGQEYEYKANIDTFNHDAILVGEIGAATPEQGVGIFVNADGEQEVEVMYCNLSSGEDFSLSSNAIRSMIDKAAKEANLFGDEEKAWGYVEDFNDTTAIFYSCDKMFSVDYKITNGEVEFVGELKEVSSQRSYTFGGVIGKIVDIVKSVVKSTGQDAESEIPMNNSREGEQVEKQEVQQMIADALAVNAEQTAKTVQDAVTAALAANKAATKQAEKDGLIQQVVNAKLLTEDAAKECGVTALRGLLANQKQPAFGLNANRAAGNESADPFADYKFEG
jgi:predicted HAD superfamily Cof-like phosphohydrolase